MQNKSESSPIIWQFCECEQAIAGDELICRLKLSVLMGIVAHGANTFHLVVSPPPPSVRLYD